MFSCNIYIYIYKYIYIYINTYRLHGACDIEKSTVPIFCDDKGFTWHCPSCAIRFIEYICRYTCILFVYILCIYVYID